MSQNPFSQKVRIYTHSAAALIAVAILLRCLNFLTIFDSVTDYFANHPLHSAYRALCVLTVGWLLTSLLFIPRYAFSTKIKYTAGRFSRITGAICAVTAAASFFFFKDAMIYFATQAELYNALAILSLIATLYFAFYTVGASEPLHALSGYVTIVWFGLMLSVTYLDLYIPMNSPFKITLHIALFGAMLHVLEDVRNKVGRPFRVTYLAYTLIGILGTGTASIPVLLAYVTGHYENIDMLFYAALMLVLFLHLCSRAYDGYRILMVTPPASEEEIAADKAARAAKKAKKKQSPPTEEEKGASGNEPSPTEEKEESNTALTEQNKGENDHVS